MTLAVSTRRDTHYGDGGSTAFDYTFRAFAAADVTVYAGGDLQVAGTDYDITVGADGGTVTFLAAPAADTEIILVGTAPAEQDADYGQGDDFAAEAHERVMDRLAARIQELEREVGRCVRMPATDFEASLQRLPGKATRANKAFYFDSSGDPMAVTPEDSSAETVTAAGSTTSRGLAERFGEKGNPYDFGAKGDGVTDDTAAWAAMFAVHKDCEIPPGAFVLGALAVPSYTTIEADASPGYTDDSGDQTPKILGKAGATHIFDVGGKTDIRFIGLFIDGQNQVVNAIGATGANPVRVFVEDVTIIDCTGFGIGTTGKYFQGLRTDRVNISGCDVGIGSPIDGRLTDTTCNANRIGIQGLGGADSNQIANGRLEWNTEFGLTCFGCSVWKISTTIFDRNYEAGVKIDGYTAGKGTTAITFAACEFWRNGRDNVADEDCHILFDDNSGNAPDGIDFTGCTTLTGADDGGGGPTTPKYAIRWNAAATNVRILGGDMEGATVSAEVGSRPVDLVALGVKGIDTRVSFHAHKGGTDQPSIPNDTWTDVSFGSEDFDKGGYFDAGTGVFSPPEGDYLFHIQTTWKAMVDQTLVQLRLLKDGAEHRLDLQRYSGAGLATYRLPCLDHCDGTNGYKVQVKQASGASKDLAGDASQTFFSAVRVDGRQ